MEINKEIHDENELRHPKTCGSKQPIPLIVILAESANKKMEFKEEELKPPRNELKYMEVQPQPKKVTSSQSSRVPIPNQSDEEVESIQKDLQLANEHESSSAEMCQDNIERMSLVSTESLSNLSEIPTDLAGLSDVENDMEPATIGSPPSCIGKHERLVSVIVHSSKVLELKSETNESLSDKDTTSDLVELRSQKRYLSSQQPCDVEKEKRKKRVVERTSTTTDTSIQESSKLKELHSTKEMSPLLRSVELIPLNVDTETTPLNLVMRLSPSGDESELSSIESSPTKLPQTKLPYLGPLDLITPLRGCKLDNHFWNNSTTALHLLQKEKAVSQLYYFYRKLKMQKRTFTIDEVNQRMHSSVEAMYGNGSQSSYPVLTISVQNTPTDVFARRILGYRISYVGQCPQIASGQKCRLLCVYCQVCPHMYSCNCSELKYKHEGWCYHIHAAVHCGSNRFEEGLVAYFHVTKRRMQLAHVRALCYSLDDLVDNGDRTYRVNSPGNLGNGSGPVYSVRWHTGTNPFCARCPRYKYCMLCAICRHSYSCTCDQYKVERLLCEHCHAVAIKLTAVHKQPANVASLLGLDDNSENTDEDSEGPPSVSDSMADRSSRRKKRIIAAHHERALAIPPARVKPLQDHPGKYIVLSSRCDIGAYIVTRVAKWCYSHVEDQCHYCCLDCRICEYRYSCNCGKPADQICKHIHAVTYRRRASWFESSDIRVNEI